MEKKYLKDAFSIFPPSKRIIFSGASNIFVVEHHANRTIPAAMKTKKEQHAQSWMLAADAAIKSGVAAHLMSGRGEDLFPQAMVTK